MKLASVLKHTLPLLKDNDIIIFVGDNIINEALKYKKENYFYLENKCSPAAFATGIAMCTDKRVFVLCSSEIILKDLSAATQAAVSECKNLFFMILDTGYFDASNKRSTVFRSMRASKNLFFGMGFIVYDYNIYYRDVKTIKQVKNSFEHVLGPLLIILKIDKYKPQKAKEVKNDIINFSNFITDDSLGSSLFVRRYNG